MTECKDLPTVVVGGLGGSGTRVVAALLQAGGVCIGHDLNNALDNLWATMLFKRGDVLRSTQSEIESDITLLSRAMLGGGGVDEAARNRLYALVAEDRPQHPAGWLRERVENLLVACESPRTNQAWGWKEPNTHILLPYLSRLTTVRYIHVTRSGFYMARSRNRNQHAYWGELLTGQSPVPTPTYALKYWCAVEERTQVFARIMGRRFLRLDYDLLCADPQAGLDHLNSFLSETGISIPTSNTALIEQKNLPTRDVTDLDVADVVRANRIIGMMSE